MGSVEENCRRMSRFLKESAQKQADLTIFPELSVVGYPPKDHIEMEGFVGKSRQALDRLAADHSGQNFIAGFIEESGESGKGKFNAAAFCSGGKVQFIQRKTLLPTYDVFEETRYFDSAEGSDLFEVAGEKIGITICEDIWTDEELLEQKLYQRNPAEVLKQKGATLIVNLSASPYRTGKEKIRQRLLERLVERLHVPFVYVNLVGGNDEILFDGGSVALNEKGTIIGRAKVFQEDLVVVDLKKGEGEIQTWPASSESWQADALVMGIRDYVGKCGFKKVVIGLSGGIDSALVTLLAAEALGPKHVVCVSMPSSFTSGASQRDAAVMTAKLGVELITVPIHPLMKEYDQALSKLFREKPRDVTEENIQARIRGNLLMALSNKFGWLVLATGNKSELAVGYCTQYGDMVGGLAVIADLFKNEVYTLAQHLNELWKPIPDRVFRRPPSAELRPDQKDEDSLPPYEVLDPILKRYVEEMASVESIVNEGFDQKVVEEVIELVNRNEYKRRQAAPGLRLSRKAFGVGWRMPIARGKAQ